MTVARYWRIRGKSSGGGGNSNAIVEMEFRETAGGPDVTVVGGTTASSTFSGGAAAANAVDNNLSTYWQNHGTDFPNGWVDNDLGTAKEIREVALSVGANNSILSSLIRTGVIDYSDDRVNWTAHTAFSLTAWTSAAETKLIAIPVDPGAVPNDMRVYAANSEVLVSAPGSMRVFAANTEVLIAPAGLGRVYAANAEVLLAMEFTTAARRRRAVVC